MLNYTKISLVVYLLASLMITSCQLIAKDTNTNTRKSDTLFKNVNILDIESNTVLSNRQVYIQDGVIAQISAKDITPSTNRQVIDGHNKFLIPGLIDMHVHVFEHADLSQLLRYGVTTARIMHGWPHLLDYRSEVEQGLLAGPDMIVSSPIVNQKSPFANSNIHNFVSNAEQAKELIQDYKQQGYDLIKTYDGLRKDTFQQIAETAAELNIPVAGHPSFFLSIDEYLASNPQTIEHVEMLYQANLDYSREREPLMKLTALLAAQKIPVTTTLVAYDNLARIAVEKEGFLSKVPKQYIHPIHPLVESDNIKFIKSQKKPQTWREKADYLGHMAKVLADNNVPLVVGSDGGIGYNVNGKSTHDEIQLLHHYGISSEVILRSATIEPAKALGLEQKIGKVAVGYRANLLLVDQDPRENLEVLRTPLAVVKQGDLYHQQGLEKLNQQALEHMGWMETALKLLGSL